MHEIEVYSMMTQKAYKHPENSIDFVLMNSELFQIPADYAHERAEKTDSVLA